MNTSQAAIFVSHLRGLPVVTRNGDQVGKLRDVVIQLRTGRQAPRVKGLVVELFARRRVFVPIVRVHSIDAQQVLVTSQLSADRFQRRDAEILVVDDLFDRTVHRPGAGTWVIFDISIQPSRSREWEVAEVALQEMSGRRFKLGGRGQTQVLEWWEVPGLISKGGQSTDNIIARMVDMKPADVARELHDLSPDRRSDVVNALDDNQLADAVEELPENEQVDLISHLTSERAAKVLSEMDPDDAADLVRELPDDYAEQLLELMNPEEAEDVRNLLIYEDFTAGAMMTPEPVILGPDATVADALAKMRIQEFTPALASMAFICRPPLDTPSGRYLGAVHIQRLLREPPSSLASSLIDSNLEPLTPDSPLPTVSRYFAIYNLVVVPVVNSDTQLVGAVTVDDLIDHMLPSDWRGDQMAGESPEEVTSG